MEKKSKWGRAKIRVKRTNEFNEFDSYGKGGVQAYYQYKFIYISSVQSLSRVWLFATPGTAARQASLSITNFQSLPKPMSFELVMPSNHLILCRPLLLLPSIFPSIRVFSNESALRIRWPKCWSSSFSISPSSEHPGPISFRVDYQHVTNPDKRWDDPHTQGGLSWWVGHHCECDRHSRSAGTIVWLWESVSWSRIPVSKWNTERT